MDIILFGSVIVSSLLEGNLFLFVIMNNQVCINATTNDNRRLKVSDVI